MISKTDRVLNIIHEKPHKIFTSELLRREFNKRYSDELTKAAMSRILTKVIRHTVPRTPTQTNEGYAYCANESRLREYYESFLLPEGFSCDLIPIITRKNFSELPSISPMTIYGEYMAELVGFTLGDGNLSQTTKNVQFFFYLHYDAMQFAQTLSRVWGVPPRIVRHAGCWKVTVHDTFLHSTLVQYGVPPGNRVTLPFEVPKWILTGSAEIKRAFLRGMFGAEGSKPFQGRKRIQLVLCKKKQHVNNLLL